jgi:Glycosyl transferase family 2
LKYLNLQNNLKVNYSIISANVRDDNDYLDEWIGYHLSIGFEHIVIYDHLSRVPVDPKWNKVTVYRLERESLFKPEFIHNHTLHKHKSFWMAHIDVDEFIVLESNNINDFMQKYEQCGALGIPWSMFGSSGHTNKPKGLVKDNYLYRKPDENPEWIKSIINTQFCTVINDPHHGIYTVPAVNEDFVPIEGPRAISSRKSIRLNHYFTRSLEEYKRKIERGTGNPQTPVRPLQWLYDIDSRATIYDDKLLNYDSKRTLE